MKRFLLHILQVVLLFVAFASPVILIGLTMFCFVTHKIILGIVFSVAFILCLGIVTYDWRK